MQSVDECFRLENSFSRQSITSFPNCDSRNKLFTLKFNFIRYITQVGRRCDGSRTNAADAGRVGGLSSNFAGNEANSFDQALLSYRKAAGRTDGEYYRLVKFSRRTTCPCGLPASSAQLIWKCDRLYW